MRFKSFLNEKSQYKESAFKLLGVRNPKEVNKELQKAYQNVDWDNKGDLISSLEDMIDEDLGFKYGVVFANKIDVFGRFSKVIDPESSEEDAVIIDKAIIYYKSKVKGDPLSNSIISSIQHQASRVDGRFFNHKFSVIRPGEYKLEVTLG